MLSPVGSDPAAPFRGKLVLEVHHVRRAQQVACRSAAYFDFDFIHDASSVVSDAVYYTIIVFSATQRRKNGRKAGGAPSGETLTFIGVHIADFDALWIAHNFIIWINRSNTMSHPCDG